MRASFGPMRQSGSGIAQINFTFLGTSSAVPTLRRNVTSAALRVDGEVMVFDCGEGTQHQLMRAQSLRQGRIKRLLVTHLHGDHLFGLPGLVTGLCGVKKDMYRDLEEHQGERGGAPVVLDKLRIYGPRGIKEFLACALRVSRMKIPRDYLVHELVDSQEEAALLLNQNTGVAPHDPGEPLCNTVVAPRVDGEGRRTWDLFQGPNYSLSAGHLVHTVPCWGYVFAERDQPGPLDLEKLMASPLGSKRVGPWLAALKSGEVIDGVRREDVCGPMQAGRKVVVLGDTCDPSGVAHLARKCNLLVHEVTMRDLNKSKAFRRGHSTATMAGSFAASVQAMDLAVTHFGGEISANTNNLIFPEIAASVKRTFGKPPIFARDFLSLSVERKQNLTLSTGELTEDGPSWLDPDEFEED